VALIPVPTTVPNPRYDEEYREWLRAKIYHDMYKDILNLTEPLPPEPPKFITVYTQNMYLIMTGVLLMIAGIAMVLYPKLEKLK
jgi:hypothetical protein